MKWHILVAGSAPSALVRAVLLFSGLKIFNIRRIRSNVIRGSWFSAEKWQMPFANGNQRQPNVMSMNSGKESIYRERTKDWKPQRYFLGQSSLDSKA